MENKELKSPVFMTKYVVVAPVIPMMYRYAVHVV